jgi:lysophospholipase L1-like esterase
MLQRRTLLGSLLLTLVTSTTLLAGNEKNYTYLALGDSVAFGLDITLLVSPPPLPPPTLPSPDAFVGYPEALARIEHLLQPKKEVNTSCPGETSASFINANVIDYGCHSRGPDGEPPFTSIGLHTNYEGAQLDYAIAQLKSNKHIDLVTLSIGANDMLMMLRDCSLPNAPEHCVDNGVPAVLNAYAGNLTQILAGIRVGAKYDGRLVLVKYYSPAKGLNGIALSLNAVMDAVGKPFNVIFADGFKAFEDASKDFGGDPCAAGMLIPVGPGVCDIHPTPLGRDLLAAVIEEALQRAR